MKTGAGPAVETEPPVFTRVPYTFARRNGVMPARIMDGVVETWVREDATNPLALAEVRRVLKLPVRCEFLDAEKFDQALERIYANAGDDAFQFMEDISQDQDLGQLVEEMPHDTDLLEMNDAPVIRFINTLLAQALHERASDIHFELFDKRSVVRFRIDGVLKDVIEPPRALHTAIISRIKIMGRLDIAEKRLPQDGRYTLSLAGRPVDARISTIPTGHGERVALRLLDQRGKAMELEDLGMSANIARKLSHMVQQPHGIILVTGPTGSGKTTTLYAALRKLDTKKLNVMTVEDPIEYDLDGVNQTQVNPRIGMTFSRAIRAMLRQDPDVIMIGEIRDLETARIAVQASLTGHLVLATAHTNDSVSAIARLVDMGVEPYLLASSLVGVLAQRLVRRLCRRCRSGYQPGEAELKITRTKPGVLYAPGACPMCGHTGYRGRSGIFELFVVDDVSRGLIHDLAPEQEIRARAVDTVGMADLRDDGIRLVGDGTTCLEEVLRVTEV